MTGAPAEAANDVIKYGDTAVRRRMTITLLALCITVTQEQRSQHLYDTLNWLTSPKHKAMPRHGLAKSENHRGVVACVITRVKSTAPVPGHLMDKPLKSRQN